MKIIKVENPKWVELGTLNTGDIFETHDGQIGMYVGIDEIPTFQVTVMLSGLYKNTRKYFDKYCMVIHHKNVELLIHPEAVNNDSI